MDLSGVNNLKNHDERFDTWRQGSAGMTGLNGLLGLSQLALILIEVAQVVDGVECGCMLRALCFLVSLQCPLIFG